MEVIHPPINNEQMQLLNRIINSGSSSSHLSSLDAAASEPPNENTDIHNQQQKVLPAVAHIKDETIPKDSWLILGGLKVDQRFEEKPLKFSGYMLKRRKRPLKGESHPYYHCC